MGMVRKAVGATGIGAALAYFLDPDQGKRRRHVLRDRIGGTVRGIARRGERSARAAGAYAYGTKQRLTHLGEQPKAQPNDATLARKVETEIFRDADVPKGKINVNAERGVVYLRGEARSPEQIKWLIKQASEVQGVRQVESRLQTIGSAS
jgi:osmotically-inducible protein OsmY